MPSSIRRERSATTLSDAASALLGIAASPEAPSQHRSRRQKTEGGGFEGYSRSNEHSSRSNSNDSNTQSAIAQSLSSEDDYAQRAGATSPSNSREQHSMPGSVLGGSAAVASGLGGRHARHVAAQSHYRAAPPPHAPVPASELELLTSASVLLATCGLVHALNVSTTEAPRSRRSSQESSGSTAEEASRTSSAGDSGSGSATEQPSEGGISRRPTAEKEVEGEAAEERPSSQQPAEQKPLPRQPPAFGLSVWRILRQECRHVRALDRSDFARLCQLLDLPLER